MDQRPAAFMSYVRFDDQYENGRLTEFKKRLSNEVHLQTGDEFIIFQDREDIRWGQNWSERIEHSLGDVTFLIPIITPSFFRSSACRHELELFLEREKKLKRNDLVLPVYYIDCPLLNDERKRANDELAQAIASRQYADWRELRFKTFTSQQVSRVLAQLAIQIREGIERITIDGVNTGISKHIQRPTAITEPPTHIVDPMHRGDYDKISKAIRESAPGDRILVRPGLYRESLVITKPLEIIGDGTVEEIVIETKDKTALSFRTTMGRVSNLTLRQIDTGTGVCIEIAQGRLELEDCDITNKGLNSCILIHSGADPRVRRNRIHDCGEGFAIDLFDNCLGTLEENDIFSNDNGVGICNGANPILRSNRIHHNKEDGVVILENGLGTLEENDIFSNGKTGVRITSGSISTLSRNRINMNGGVGIWVNEGGGGVIEDNDLRANRKGAWKVTVDSKSKLKRARNQDETI